MKSFNRIRCLNQVACEIIDEYKLFDIDVADIGADHGYLAELLSRNEKIKKIYATDISQKCLDKTNELVARCDLKKIETKLGDGLDAIDSAKISIIAGMGGYEIINMLSNQNITKNSNRKCEIFILQPSKNVAELREFLIDKNYAIVRDFMVKSAGKFYPIIVADLSKQITLEKDVFNLYFGCGNKVTNPVFIDYLNDVIFRLKFCNELKNKSDLDDETKVKIQIYKLAEKLIKKNKGD